MLKLMKFLTSLCTPIGALLLVSAGLAAQQRATFIDLTAQPKWQTVSSKTLSLKDLGKWGGEPAVDREYGVQSVEVRTYQEGPIQAHAVIEDTPDPSSAFGLLTFYQNKSMIQPQGMELAVISPQWGFMARGKVFLRVQRPAGMSNTDFRTLLVSIGGHASPAEAMALLPPPLPVKERVPGSEKYVFSPIAAHRALPFFRTDLVGFEQGAEIQSAAYLINQQLVHFFLISYPTTQIAKLRFRSLSPLLDVHQRQSSGSLYGKREGTYVLMVQNAPSEKVADNLMGRLRVSQQVSWNAPAPGKPITVQMVQLLIGNILLVLILIGMAVAAGVMIFLGRRLVSKWFPQAQWARGYEDSIIRLNLKWH